jgi:hypothetical protein
MAHSVRDGWQHYEIGMGIAACDEISRVEVEKEERIDINFN